MTRSEATKDRLPLIQYWNSAEVPVKIAELTATFRDLNPDLLHLLFNEAEAEEFIAEHLGEREVAAFRSCAVPAMQADYFRYCAVLVQGGVYCDADFRCLRPLHTLLGAIDGGVLFRRMPQENLVNGLFAFSAPGHPLLRLALNVATINVEQRVAGHVNMTTGPWVFSGLWMFHQLGSFDAGRCYAAAKQAERIADRMAETVGDFGRIEEAFGEIRIEPFDKAKGWIDEAGMPPSHRESAAHWSEWHSRGASIFR
jgi:mannosyltransferase OCH1-like enzyme